MRREADGLSPNRWRDARERFGGILPPRLAAIPIALVYGAICAGKGMSVLETTFACARVFASGAQFAATEL